MVDIVESVRIENVQALLSAPSDVDEVGFSEDPQVLGDRLLRDVTEVRTNLARRPWPISDEAQHRLAPRLCQSSEGLLATHVSYFRNSGPFVQVLTY